MVEVFLVWLVAIVVVEAVVELVMTGSIFDKPLTWVHNTFPNSFISKLLACGYCFSVWVAASLAWTLPGHLTKWTVLDIVLKTFFLHRMANYLHDTQKKILQRFVSESPEE